MRIAAAFRAGSILKYRDAGIFRPANIAGFSLRETRHAVFIFITWPGRVTDDDNRP